jgi:integrase
MADEMPTWMTRSKSGTYSLRVRVPDALRPIIGKREIKQSYKTSDFEKAKRQHRFKEAEVQDLFDDARAKLRAQAHKKRSAELPPIEIDAHTIRRLVRAFHAEQIADAKKRFPDECHDEGYPSPRDREEFVETLEQDLTFLRDAGDPNTVASMQKTAEDVLETNFGPCEVPTEILLDLAEMLRRASVDVLRKRIEWYQGDGPDDDSQPVFMTGAAGSTANAGLKLRELIEQYLNDPSSSRSEKTKDGYQLIIRVMDDVIGMDTAVSEIDRSVCRDVQAVIRHLPANATKRKGFKTLSPSAAAEKAQKEGVAPLAVKTANNALNNMSSIFEWAVREGYLDSNPAKRLNLPRRDEDDRSKRMPFSDAQLGKIFSGPIYKDKVGAVGSRKYDPKLAGDYWVPLLALYTGMRSNECCQLLTADIVKIDGIDVIRVTKKGGGGKRLKTAASERIIPIHPKLIEMGFVEYADHMRRQGEERLFPHLKQSAKGYYSDNFQKKFGRYLSSVSAKEPKTSFHSFRHNFRDAMRLADVPDWIAKRLGGWKEQGTDAVYGGNTSVGVLLEQIRKLNFRALDI